MTTLNNSLEAALFGRYSIASPYHWICHRLDAAHARHEARKSYRYLLDHEDARRDVGVSVGDVHSAIARLR